MEKFMHFHNELSFDHFNYQQVHDAKSKFSNCGPKLGPMS